MFETGDDSSETTHIDDNYRDQLDDCRVPGTKHEYFDCCFSLSHSTCESFGYTNIAILMIMLAVFIRLLFKSTWFRFNKLLLFTCLFQFLVLASRIVYMFHAGYKGSSKLVYMLFKAGGPSFTILSLFAFLAYL